ncbi:MAG: helix-turn-helix domain-containing protein [Acidobacteria bacterium]|nr:helix-turn-helix domain-containing protein [Acidobacteriota bacterium]
MGPANSIGSRLQERRKQLGLTLRDVEAASRAIANAHGNRTFLVRASRLSEIENHNRTPGVACLYSLSVILNQSFFGICSWCGLNLRERIADRKRVRCELEQRALARMERRRRKELEREEKRRMVEQRRRKRERSKQRIVTWLRSGLTYTEMARRLGVSKQCVQQWATQTDYGRRLAKRRRHRRERRNQRILQLLAKGATCEHVAKHFGLTRQRVHQVAQRLGHRHSHSGSTPSPSLLTTAPSFM